ncbi:RND family efflux transporter MFP subunit [Planktotalea frisia]|jgi:RND family efflux transporter MFP subunit|uniref:Efflux pump periplasmic linker BepD n=1 Tax=Planktotalea frisia TaxID=696762 RepID=A0A1L9NS55_9RHOB|nr:HlyD family efflux transporter periplasmic adaptor subunit [Planktotalea frisia]OJI92140.1 efflux pump periplasmic linker BepD precursor [Planktotalea frisia]PZX22659.1 RND family efflux transporter MFP subunit [Planktotalea frisia]
MRFLRNSLAGLFLVAMTGALLVYAGSMIYGAVQARMSEEPRPSRSRERVFSVTVLPANIQSVEPILTSFGQIESARTLDLRAGASGTVLALSENFVEGGSVTAGEQLVQIDQAEAQSAFDRADSDLSDAKLEAREAARAIGLAQDELDAAREQVALREKAFERQEDLSRRGVGTAAAVETAELAASSARQAVLSRRQALAQAEARIEQAQTRIARAELAKADASRRLDDTVITAEFAGALSDVTASRGGLVNANERLARLIDPNALEVAFRLSTAQYARLLDENGVLGDAPVSVVLDVFGADLVAQGTLSRDSAAVGEGQSGRLVFAKLDKAPGFKPGDFVRVEVTEPEVRGVVRLPATALGADEKVLVIGEEDRLEALQVSLVRRQGDDVLVRGRGLVGRNVVSARTPLLGAGIKVKPLTAEGVTKIEEPEMLELSQERRDKIRAFIQANKRIPEEAKARILGQLDEPKVPAQMVQRIEGRMGG